MEDTLLQDLVMYRKSKDKGTMMAAKGLHVVPPADALPRLGILDDRVVVIDLVFGVLVTRSGGGPVPFQGRADLQIVHLSLPFS